MDLLPLPSCFLFSVVALLALAALLYFLLGSVSHAVPPGFYDTQRRFLLTGCASGIGRHLAKVLVQKGHRVMATDVNRDGLAELERECQGLPGGGELVTKALDVTKQEHWASASKEISIKFGGCDCWMNIAGYLWPSRIQDVRPQDIDQHVDINIKGVMFGTKFASDLMANMPGPGGHIINFASLGAVAPVSGVTLYIASKYAVRGFSLCASKDLAPLNLHVSCVCPDAVKTAMVDLQLHFEASALAYSGGMLSVDDVERVMLTDVLVNRPVELWIPAEFIRGFGARLADVFHSARVIKWAEQRMSAAGVAVQKERLQQASQPRLQDHWAVANGPKYTTTYGQHGKKVV